MAVRNGTDTARTWTRRGVLGAGVLGAAAVATVMLRRTSTSGPPALGIPAYAYPGTEPLWDELEALGRGATVIVNPASGPGTAVDPRYADVVQRLRAQGATLLGYVDTDFGRRTADAMLDDARPYREWYGLEGIFLDQTPGESDHVAAWYEPVVGELRTFATTIAINPGQPQVDRRYVDLADHVMNFEGPIGTYLTTAFPTWVSAYPRDRFWHLVYDVASSEAMQHALDLVQRRHAGHVYITDAGMPNPWHRLPSYWTDELAALGLGGRGTS